MKTNNFLQISGIYIFIGILISLNACALKTSPTVSLTSPDDKKIPIRVGYFLSSDFSKLEYYKRGAGGYTYLKIGETLSNGVETVLRKAFEEAVRLPSKDINLTSEKIKAIVVPELIEIDMYLPSSGFGARSLVKMKWTIFDNEKNILYVNEITGEAQKSCMMIWCRREMMELAIQDQFQKALDDILKQEWWKSVI